MNKITTAELENLSPGHESLLLDFSSPGCAPCQKLQLLLHDWAKEAAFPSFSLCEVDITREPGIAQKYFVLSVPTLIVLRQAKEIARFTGIPKKQKLLEALS
jgi:thioredoxin 1